MASQTDRLYGEVILSQSVPTRILTAGIVGIVAAAGLFVGLGSYSRIETAKGVVVPAGQSSKVFALRPGVISTLLVREGDAVAAGQKLAIVSSDQPAEDGLRYTEEGVAALGAQEGLARDRIALAGDSAAQQRARLGASLDGLVQQQANLSRQLALQAQLVASSRNLFEQLGPVIEKGFVSKLEVERRRQSYINAQQQEAQLKTQLDNTATQIAQVEADLGRIVVERAAQVVDAKTALEGYRQQKSRLETERSYAINAPIAGRVTALQTATGRTVGGQVPLLTIIPEAVNLEADVYVASRAIGFVREGQEVRLLYDAFPYQRFGSFTGKIASVSRVIIAPNELDAPLRIEEPVYKVKVRLERQAIDAFGQQYPLQAGMTLTANVILDRLSFWDWLMAPLRAVTNRTS
ncbi:HlyD family efflux transporter periplasmic adaptor subunit [Novosphingobium ginsenosidimutans]|uniref:HlyD family efflux transporter periplasmic adaptor subunit n=1 Tax=Novosphingobium ginsenosidimutans TaxID=1176536 RepID=A0A5B8S376_9SPHN|nr:HlyD family efflux transporter periplasmic adaptor subunit [Novosphingobium ginsenosidimutans]QEA15871.1 HlyD family efflux transporter periplasmic adaptor subunit [Novosphingobium ginsenosidimutans]